MTEIYEFDSPLTRLKQEYDEKLAQQTMIADKARNALAIAQEQSARVRATRDMLILLMTDMSDQIAAMSHQITAMANNINELRNKLREMAD